MCLIMIPILIIGLLLWAYGGGTIIIMVDELWYRHRIMDRDRGIDLLLVHVDNTNRKHYLILTHTENSKVFNGC